jgi:hypothetical protein
MTRSNDEKRAYDHYRWAQRYTKYGETEKAQAHMQRALHYGKSMGFGTGPEGPERAGSARRSQGTEELEDGSGPKRQRTSDESASRTGSATGGPSGKTDIVFILGPLNASAVEKIEKSIQDSKAAGNKLEVYMQAFTEQGKVFRAPNLLPMNFNQYSSDVPTALVNIINDNQDGDKVEFYIFPTQTTKNDHFWKNSARLAFESKVATRSALSDIDELIGTSIVSWLKKDEDLKTGGGDYELKDKTFADLQDLARNPEKIKTLPGAQTIFDPFCAVCAAHKNTKATSPGTVFSEVLKDVGGSGLLVAQGVEVFKDNNLTADEAKDLQRQTSSMERPRFTHFDGQTNCFVVTWGSEEDAANERTKAAGQDGAAYIDELWISFLKSGTRSKGMRTVNRILIVQDYYDYDNKMSVWYILHAFKAEYIELFSVTRPLADKEVMRAMREKQNVLEFVGGYSESLKTSPLGDEAMHEWHSKTGPTYPVSGPVFTTQNFDPSGVNVRGAPLTLQMFKDAIEMTPARKQEAEAESEQIAYTWYMFMQHMLSTGRAGSKQVTWAVTNGGYTERHGLNPAMHTIIEDWYTFVPRDLRKYVAIGKTIERRHDASLIGLS